MRLEDIPITYQTRSTAGTRQDLMPSRYGLPIQLFSMAAFTLAFVGWLNETWLFWFENPIWLNRYTEYAIILGFGLWRILAEQNSYTRKRLIILVTMITVFWWGIPWLTPFYESYVGFLWAQPVFPSLHVPGTITFFLILALVFLFGRRIICGFNCPCVGIRETVGFAFRDRTLRSDWAWKLRHSKWFFFTYYVGVMVVTQFSPNSWTVSFVGGFYLLIALTYFGTFFIAPIVGNRFYCRYLCPYGATFGLLNHAGFYGIKMEQDKCIDCRRCEQVCDMGIPVWKQGKESGRVTALEDCMGCARCVVSCPTDALAIQDVRNMFRPKLVQNASHLLKRGKQPVVMREGAEYRSPDQRTQDWQEITQTPEFAKIQAQATRCLDCGVPGCANACPLSNRIPEWLEAVANGNIEMAAEISNSTSNLPEVCGRLCPQHRLCEGSCTKAKEPDGAVTIGAIEQFINDEALKHGWRPTIAKQYNNKHVAIIGAGPAGLACADELNKAGCDVTVFDMQSVIGGLMANGVPPFKLNKKVLIQRHEILKQNGVKFELGIKVEQNKLRQLLESNDAVFLGTGTQTSRDLKLPGQTIKGVTTALKYLDSVNKSLSNKELMHKHVIVLGGGDSAMDCARSAIRQGASQVSVAYRGNEKQMCASPKERQSAIEEGVQFLYHHNPKSILGDGRVAGMHFDTDQTTDKMIVCDQVVLAVGQVPDTPVWLSAFDIKTGAHGVIEIDHNGQTSNPKIFAGGDNTNGPDLVVTAVAAGRKAAEGILNSFSLSKRMGHAVTSLLNPVKTTSSVAPVAASVIQQEPIR